MLCVDQQEILRRLLGEVAKATDTDRIVHEAFRAILKDIPSGLPHPDGSQRITNASTVWAHSRERLRIATTRLEQFQLYGFIPEDLR
jgi:hypothetical protein